LNGAGVVGVMTRLRAGRFGARIPVEVRYIFLNRPDKLWGQTCLLCNKQLPFFQGVKRLGLHVNQAVTSIADFKNEWGYASDSPYSFTN